MVGLFEEQNCLSTDEIKYLMGAIKPHLLRYFIPVVFIPFYDFFQPLHEYMDSDWYDSNDEWLYYRKSIIAWRPYLVPEPYIPEEEVKDGWHPVSDDPPKKESHYWVQLCDTDGNYAGMCECNWTDAGYVFPHTKTDWHWVNPQFTKVVAWRKLPDMYIEEEQ